MPSNATDTAVFTWPSAGVDIVRSHTVTGLSAGSKVYIGVLNQANTASEVQIHVGDKASATTLTLGKAGFVTAVEAECGTEGHAHEAGTAEVLMTWGGTGSATDEYQVYWHVGNPHEEGKTMTTVCGLEDLMADVSHETHDHRLRLAAATDHEKGQAFHTFTKNIQQACLELKTGKTYYVNVMVRAADGSLETAYKPVMLATSTASTLTLSMASIVLTIAVALMM